MKNTLGLIVAFLMVAATAFAQPQQPSAQETARSFLRTGDFENAILVLNRALQHDEHNLDLLKDLAMTHYYKRDYVRALATVKPMLEREDTDVVTYQIGGNVYKALEEVKEADKMYKKGLKKFPEAGPLYSEYGELLWAKKDYSAIDLWEKGIKVDPAFPGNYYNAATYYFYTKDRVWSIIYGEVFVNMESLTERSAAMRQLILDSYKEKLFNPEVAKDEKIKNDFSKAYLEIMGKQSNLVNKGVNLDALIMVRTRFILDWFKTYAGKFPHKLFDYQQQLLQAGMFEAYNHWLFGSVDNLTAYENWTKQHSDAHKKFTDFQRNRVFKMPAGQYYNN